MTVTYGCRTISHVDEFDGKAMWDRVEQLARGRKHWHEKHNEVNWKAVADFADLSRNTIRAGAERRVGMHADTLFKLARAYDVSAHWILTGLGPRGSFSAETPTDPKSFVLEHASSLFHPAVISEVADEEMPGQSVFYWTRRVEAARDRLVAEGKIRADEAPPPQRPKKKAPSKRGRKR